MESLRYKEIQLAMLQYNSILTNLHKDHLYMDNEIVVQINWKGWEVLIRMKGLWTLQAFLNYQFVMEDYQTQVAKDNHIISREFFIKMHLNYHKIS